jgi:homoserine dehydrogenase
VTAGVDRRPIRVALVGFGAVGRWLARAFITGSDRFEDRYGAAFSFVAVGNATDGYVHDGDGIDLEKALALADRGNALTNSAAIIGPPLPTASGQPRRTWSARLRRAVRTAVSPG